MSDTSDRPTVSGGDSNRGVVVFEISPRSIWHVIGAILLTVGAVIVFNRARGLVVQLIIAFFFALAIVPLVERIHKKRGWKRGAAVGAIYGVFLLFFLVMVFFLIPMMVDVATLIGDNAATWATQANQWVSDTFGVSLSGPDLAATGDAGADAAAATSEWLQSALGSLLGVFATGIGLIFAAMTIALFTFYFAANNQRIQTIILSWFNPDTQERLGWTWDTAMEQTGGYFYSRMILMVINGSGFFFTMVLVGLPTAIALPLAIFAGFVSEFIPAIGTYIGGAIPIAITLAMQGMVQGLIVLGYVLVYQQVENYWLSPKVSAQTMTLNGGVAFGAALAGGAIGGPMGAFMALPVAALITSFIGNYHTPREVVYKSKYADDDQEATLDRAEPAAES